MNPKSSLRIFALLLSSVGIIAVIALAVRSWRSEQPTLPGAQNTNLELGQKQRAQSKIALVPSTLPRFIIDISDADLRALRKSDPDKTKPAASETRHKALVTVRDHGVVYSNVTLQLKGSVGSFRPIDLNPSLTLKFSKLVPEQSFHGFTKISLNNSVQDPSFLCEAIARELFQSAGVPTPQASHATVVVNGRDLGLYVMVEGYGKHFLQRHFSNVDGNLYDGGPSMDVNQKLEVNSGNYPQDRSDLERLVQSASVQNLTNRWTELSNVLDMDRFLTFLAVSVMVGQWDGYANRCNNYRLFHDMERDRMVFLPHGLDELFPPLTPRTGSILPGRNGIVARATIAIPQGERGYMEKLMRLHTNLFNSDQLVRRVREISTQIRPTIAAYGDEAALQHDFEVNSLCQRISERLKHISEKLSKVKTLEALNTRP